MRDTRGGMRGDRGGIVGDVLGDIDGRGLGEDGKAEALYCRKRDGKERDGKLHTR